MSSGSLCPKDIGKLSTRQHKQFNFLKRERHFHKRFSSKFLSCCQYSCLLFHFSLPELCEDDGSEEEYDQKTFANLAAKTPPPGTLPYIRVDPWSVYDGKYAYL